ncbi:MAG: cation:proton antiporter [Gemmatimonadetes bacterium]|nr:cation:proton antiporter [Gemmatimonadota bacterium]MDA1103429.1 cation:proton antiporter [Gemmatimonadota bacterium]
MSSVPPRPGSSGGIIPALRLVVTLALLVGLTWLTFEVAPAQVDNGRLAIFLGFVLLAASVAGSLATEVGLPRITGFIVIGMVLGPSALELLPQVAVDDLRLIDLFALALIAMLAGGELKVGALRPQAKLIVVTTLMITGIVWIGMAAALVVISPFVPFLAELPFQGVLAVALLLGIWSANSSPDLTVAVIEEKHSTGPLSELILGVTIVKDVVVIVLFTFTLTMVAPLLDPTQSFSSAALLALGWEVGGSLLLGGALGWVFSQYLGGEGADPRSPFATFLFAYLMVVLVEEFHFELLLTGVTAGFVIENLSPAGDRMIQGIRSVAVVVFAFFFTVAGAGLDLGAVAQFGLAAVFLFFARVGLTRFATIRGVRRAQGDAHLEGYAWQGLISQGGVSLGLTLLVADRFPELGPNVVALSMAIILGNILAGPILLGRALAAPRADADGETA